MSNCRQRIHRFFCLPWLATTLAITGFALHANLCAAETKEFTVSADGTGDYKTVLEAIAAVPDRSQDRTLIRIRAARYDEGQIIIPANKWNVSFQGDDAAKTVLTYAWNQNENDPNAKAQNYRGCGVIVVGNDFSAKDITFENSSGDHGQAIALRVEGDRAAFRNCRMLGWQDTLRVSRGRQYFRDCYIEGRVDFIYGAATAVFDHCEIKSKNGGHITAASTPETQPFGFVFFNCKLTGDPTPWKNPAVEQAANTTVASSNASKPPRADLGRPWRPFGSVIYLNCWMGDHIKPEGWDNWRNAENEKTARYREFNSTGPGAKSEKRVVWSKQLTSEEAAKITPQSVLAGNDNWNPAAEK